MDTDPRPLLRAIIWQALADIQSTDRPTAAAASRWLKSAQAAEWIEAIGLDPAQVRPAIRYLRLGPPLSAGWPAWCAWLAAREHYVTEP